MYIVYHDVLHFLQNQVVTTETMCLQSLKYLLYIPLWKVCQRAKKRYGLELKSDSFILSPTPHVVLHGCARTHTNMQTPHLWQSLPNLLSLFPSNPMLHSFKNFYLKLINLYRYLPFYLSQRAFWKGKNSTLKKYSHTQKNLIGGENRKITFNINNFINGRN